MGNFLSYGDYSSGDQNDPSTFLFPRGIVLGRDLTQGPSGGSGADHRVRQPLLVRVFGRRQAQASLRRRDQPEVFRAQAALRFSRRRQEIFLAEVAPLPRQADGSGAAGAHGGGLRFRTEGYQGRRRRRARSTERSGLGAVLHAGPDRGARARSAIDGRPAGTVGRPAGRQHGARQGGDLQSHHVGSRHLAREQPRIWMA